MPACASADGLHWHRPAADSGGLRLRLPSCTHTSTRNSYAQRAWELSAQNHYRTIQHSRNAHTQAVSYIGIGLWISVYRKWALNLKILIFTVRNVTEKNLSSRQWRNRPLFWPCTCCGGTPLTIDDRPPGCRACPSYATLCDLWPISPRYEG